MATLSITEYAKMARDSAGHLIPVGMEPAVARQSITYTTAAQSAAFNASTRFILVVAASADGYLEFGTNPTATATDTRIVQDVAQFFGIDPDLAQAGTYKLSVYDGVT